MKRFSKFIQEAKLSQSQRDKLDDLILNVHMTTHPEYDGDEGPTKYLNMIRKEFGDKVAKQVNDGIEKVHWGRDNRSGGNDKLAWRKGGARITKSGKMNAQDVKALKNRIKQDKAWGGITKAVKLPEEVEQIDEISQEKLRDYHAAAGADRQKAKGQVEKIFKDKKPTPEKVQKTADAYKRFIKRGKGMTAAANKMSEEVELDEVSTEKLRDYASSALQDKNKAKADKRWKYAGKAMQTVADREVKAAHDRKYNKMEEVELDEVSDKKLDAYRQKAFADQPSGDDGSDKYRKRKFGRDLAFAKQTGRAKVLATKEEVDLDEKYKDPWKTPRKGSSAWHAAQQRKKAERDPEEVKRVNAIGNKNHMVGTAKVTHNEEVELDEDLNSIAKDHEHAAKKHSTAYKETRSYAAARNHEVAYNRHLDAAKAHREAANDKSKHSSEKLEKMSNHAWDATDHVRKHFDEEVELDEATKRMAGGQRSAKMGASKDVPKNPVPKRGTKAHAEFMAKALQRHKDTYGIKEELDEASDLRVTKVYNKFPKKATYAVHSPDRKYYKEFDTEAEAKAHKASKNEEYFPIEEALNMIIAEGVDIDDLTEAQLDELIGSVARAIGRGIKRTVVNKKGNFRFSTAGRADSAEAQAKKLEKARKDRERLQKARERIQKERERSRNGAGAT